MRASHRPGRVPSRQPPPALASARFTALSQRTRHARRLPRADAPAHVEATRAPRGVAAGARPLRGRSVLGVDGGQRGLDVGQRAAQLHHLQRFEPAGIVAAPGTPSRLSVTVETILAWIASSVASEGHQWS
jgi:hypothetical protein